MTDVKIDSIIIELKDVPQFGAIIKGSLRQSAVQAFDIIVNKCRERETMKRNGLANLCGARYLSALVEMGQVSEEIERKMQPLIEDLTLKYEIVFI